ncbi:MAG: T9SS type A sorting domain-containing protein [Salinivirgaceae bacterium]
MKNLFVAIAFLMTGALYAQEISYPAANFANIGDEFPVEYINYDSAEQVAVTELSPDLWDFSAISPTQKDTTRVKSKNDFDALSELPEETLVMKEGDYYSCMLLEGNLLQMLGILAEVEGQQLPLMFPEPIPMLNFPLTVGAGGETSMEFPITGTPEEFNMNIPMHDSVKFIIEVNASTTVESTGTLQTYNYSYPSFKISNTNIMSVDVYAKAAYVGWYLLEENAMADSTKSLQFFTPDYGIPVCRATLSWQEKLISYKIIDESGTSIEEIANIGEPIIYPNPAKAGQSIKLDKIYEQISIYTINGQKITQVMNSNTVRTDDLKPGIYIIRLNNERRGIRMVMHK